MAAHRFIHIGDTHLQHGHERNGDRLAALNQIVTAGLATPNLAAWIWPGDLFHQKSTPDDRLAIATALQRMAAAAPVVVCPGNHDHPGELEIFARLAAPWPIYVIESPQVLRFRTATRVMASCFVLPYPHKAGLIGAGVAHEQLGQTAADALDPVFIAAAAQLEEAADEDDLPLMIGHVNVGGAISSVGQPQVGKEIELLPTLLARLGPIAIALNHIHAHQQIHGAVYAGSIARCDFGEREAKGYVEWTYDDSESVETSAGVWSWRFVELDTPAMHHVEGRLTRDGFAIESIDGTPKTDVCRDRIWSGADVRVRYKFIQAEVGAIDVAHILAEFAGCRSLKLDPIPERVHQVRDPEIAAAVTLEDKVKRYAARQGLPWTPAMDAKLAALQRQDGEALVAAVTQALALMTAPPTAATEDCEAMAS